MGSGESALGLVAGQATANSQTNVVTAPIDGRDIACIIATSTDPIAICKPSTSYVLPFQRSESKALTGPSSHRLLEPLADRPQPENFEGPGQKCSDQGLHGWAIPASIR